MTKEEFEEKLSILEILYKKKYDKRIADVIYKIALWENLTTKDFENLIVMFTRYNKSWSKELPLPADIFRYLDEQQSKNNDKKLLVYEIKNSIRNNISSLFGYAVTFDNPLVHLVYETLGGSNRFRMLTDSEVEKILTYEINEDLVNSYKKTYDIPIFIGNPNSKSIRIIGNKEKILKWVSTIKNKIEKLNPKENELVILDNNKLAIANDIKDVEFKNKDIDRLLKFLRGNDNE